MSDMKDMTQWRAIHYLAYLDVTSADNIQRYEVQTVLKSNSDFQNMVHKSHFEILHPWLSRNPIKFSF